MDNIKIQFTKNVKLFGDILKVKYNEFEKKLIGTLPLIVGEYDEYGFYIENVLFKSSFSFEIKNAAMLNRLNKEFNYAWPEDWFQKYFPELDKLQLLTLKGEKYTSIEILPAIDIVEGKQWRKCTEFIAVDSESDFCGNFVQNDAEGIHLLYGDTRNLFNWKVSKFDTLKKDFTGLLSSYDFPYNNRLNDLYGKSKEYKLGVFNTLSLKEKVRVYKLLLNKELAYLNESVLPFIVKVYGNDDESWTKHFSTEEEMLQEVYLLRRLQPINKYEDIIDRKYEFTN